jgi:hypothetical protein
MSTASRAFASPEAATYAPSAASKAFALSSTRAFAFCRGARLMYGTAGRGGRDVHLLGVGRKRRSVAEAAVDLFRLVACRPSITSVT